MILGQGSVDLTRWNWRWHIKTSRPQGAGTLHSLQEALYCDAGLPAPYKETSLNKPVEKDKEPLMSDRAFPYELHL